MTPAADSLMPRDANGNRHIFRLPNGAPMPVHYVVAEAPLSLQHGYAQAYVNAWHKAMTADGEAAFASPQRATAYHEAGHIIVGAAEDWSIGWARIWKDRDAYVKGSWAGWSDCCTDDFEIGTHAPPENNLTAARQIAAGYLAERIFDTDRKGSSLDERIAVEILATWTSQWVERDKAGIVADIEQQVTAILEHNADAAHAIARALIQATPLKLKGAKLKVLTGKVR